MKTGGRRVDSLMYPPSCISPAVLLSSSVKIMAGIEFLGLPLYVGWSRESEESADSVQLARAGIPRPMIPLYRHTGLARPCSRQTNSTLAKYSPSCNMSEQIFPCMTVPSAKDVRKGRAVRLKLLERLGMKCTAVVPSTWNMHRMEMVRRIT